MSLLSRIDALRAKNDNISVNKLEKDCGLTRGSMCKWDEHTPSYDKVKKVADYFGVSAEYLLYGETEKAPGRKAEGILVTDLPEDIQRLISICQKNPGIASALINLAQQIEKGQVVQV